jgi:hypothetical protein
LLGITASQLVLSQLKQQRQPYTIITASIITETTMRKPRDYDAELKALGDRAKLLKERKIRQLGELVIAAGADVLDADVLAGALLQAVETKDAAVTEGWRRRGAGWFQGKARGAAKGSRSQPQSDLPLFGGASSDRSGESQD